MVAQKLIIVGVDPGINVGIAILDLRGKILNLNSKREAKKSDLIKHILKFGWPVVIASDVNPMPRSIEKLASAFGSKIFYPKTSLSNAEKMKIINDYKYEIGNAHQKDALAAALKAYKKYRELFSKIDASLKRKDMFDEIVMNIFRGKNIAEAIKKSECETKNRG